MVKKITGVKPATSVKPKAPVVIKGPKPSLVDVAKKLR